MKNKKIVKGIAIMISILSILSLCGCSFNSREKDNAKALEFLNKKYNKEFKLSESIERAGSGPISPAKFKEGTAYCVDDLDETFIVTKYDDGTYKDDYQNITMRSYAQEYYEKIIKNYWAECKMWVRLACLPTKDEIYSKDSYLNLLTNEGGNVYIRTFISNSNTTKKEAENIYLLSKELKEKGLKGTFCYIYTTDNSNIDNEKMKDSKRTIEDYIKEGIVVRYAIVYVNGRESLNLEEIKKSLDKKVN